MEILKEVNELGFDINIDDIENHPKFINYFTKYKYYKNKNNKDKIKKYFKKVKYYFFNLRMIQKYTCPFVIKHKNIDSYEELGSYFNLCDNYVFYLGSDVILHYSDKHLDTNYRQQIINFLLNENIKSSEKGFHLLEHSVQIKLLIKFGIIDSVDDLKWTSEQINEILNWSLCSDEDILNELIVYYRYKNLIFIEDF